MRARRDKGHPWVFMLAAGVGAASIAHGDVASATVAAVVVLWTFR